MGVQKKGHRKFIYHGREFYWFVQTDTGVPVLMILSDNKKFIIHYTVNSQAFTSHLGPKEPFVTVIGKEFKGVPDLEHCHRHFTAPVWDTFSITPKQIEEILDWCFLEEPVTEVDWRGQKIGV